MGSPPGIVGAYGGAVYLSTILGAWLADRVLGAERTLFYAAVVVMAGHVALSLVPGLAGVGLGLVLIALGSGGVKANATSLVGSLYDEHDERRDAGFSIFYMGINLGALVGPLLTGLLQKEWGFHFGFGLAAVGMAFGLAQYARGRSALPAETNEVPSPLGSGEALRYAAGAVTVVVVVAVLSVAGVITVGRLAADRRVDQRPGRGRVLRGDPLQPCRSPAWSASGSTRSSRCSWRARCSGRSTSSSSPW